MGKRTEEEKREYWKKWASENREKVRATANKHRINNKEKMNKRRMEYYYKNRDYLLAYTREWRKNNIETARAANRNYYKKPSSIIRKNISNRIKYGLFNKYYDYCEYIGCSYSKLIKHLENQFYDGMSWENYGEWHIDHIVPCSSFDLRQKYEQIICFNWLNLQPLWKEENLSKGKKYIDIKKL